MKLDPVSLALTLLLSLAVSAAAGLIQLIALNGVMDGRATTAIVLLLVFLLAGVVLTSLAAGWGARALAGNYGWNRIGAVALAAAGGVLLMVPIAFVSVVASILLAGIR